ncbi:MAG: hypothetical protein P4L72_15885 [Parvibaculum sp.]|uniref:hypothetical protein n=1 Tax=Parvibaculum sp. TaxID=2024848 RepID=UPI00283F21B0|nr:hypothetical protein [Parvibaculum sp.]MDR3500695.1 hypothetical protein [Parvibaculum sp.]
MAKNEDALKRADKIFEQVMTDPKDPNARIISARRDNTAKPFNAEDMIKRAKNASKRVRHAEEAIALIEPALNRFS